ncbi:hypothetical protein KBC79_02940 [Candidatus Woesebacteria bacterium]|nr:hypothetical protein [Candidatus Woesebacteria bacterium]
MAKKSRLTITLDQEILALVDGQIDGQKIRNRSHAIELLVSKGLKPAIDTAVLLAGGDNGASAATSQTSGRPLLLELIEHLKRFGVRKIIICAASHQEKLEAVVAGGRQLGLDILYVEEESLQGTAGAIRLARPYIGEQPFIVMHADVRTDIDLDDLIQFHQLQKTVATIAVKPRAATRKHGQAFVQGSKIVKFLEHGTDQGISIVNTGLYVLSPRIFDKIATDGPVQLEANIFPILAEAGELSAFVFQGLWQEVF